MIIREFSRTDIDEITVLMKKLCALKGQDFDEMRWRNSVEERMNKDSKLEFIVAFEKTTEQVIGMAHCSIRISEDGSRFGVVSNLIVKEKKRRSGIGEQLMKQATDYFRRNHINSIRLALKTSINDAAKILFKKLGFEEIFRVYEKEI
jgi:ribosomal protein S18 acetylase RimI-like enzyme